MRIASKPARQLGQQFVLALVWINLECGFAEHLRKQFSEGYLHRGFLDEHFKVTNSHSSSLPLFLERPNSPKGRRPQISLRTKDVLTMHPLSQIL